MKNNKISIDNNVDVELSDDLIDLMHFVPKLTEKQANETLNLFPELEYCIPIANYFFSHKEVMKAYSSYSNYLSSVHSAMNPSESIFDEEVRCRACGLPDKVFLDPCFSSGYRARPSSSKHYREHMISQDPSPEVGVDLQKSYLTRRFSTGL